MNKYQYFSLNADELQDLIADAEALIELFESAGAINQIAYKLAIVAHSALTAKPKYYAESSERRHGEPMLYSCGADYPKGRAYYTTSPAQMLRPVELKDCEFGAVSIMSGGSKDYCNGFVDGTNNAIKAILEAGYEVKS